MESKRRRVKTQNPQNQKIKRVFVLETGLEPVRTLSVHWILSPTCLPIPPLEQKKFKVKKRKTQNHFSLVNLWSEKRDSNPRPPPWQGGALPAELFSPICI